MKRASACRVTFRQSAMIVGESSTLVTAEVHVVCFDEHGELRELPPTLSFESPAPSAG